MIPKQHIEAPLRTGKRQISRYRCFTGLFIFLCFGGEAGAATFGVFDDLVLHNAVQDELILLGANPGPTVDAGEMTGVGFTTFTNNSGVISNVTGLEYATDLVSLDLSSNLIDDVTPLANLTNLQVLKLASNGETITPHWLSNPSPLSKLINLTSLDLSGNLVIEEISFLQDLVNLNYLNLGYNKIEDIGPLYQLTNLVNLYLPLNEIRNISVLRDLTNLSELDLAYNEITDLAALLDNAGIGAGDSVYLALNPLSDEALCTQIAALDALGVSFDIASACASFVKQDYWDLLLGASIPDQETLAAMDLNGDFKVDVADLIRFSNGGSPTLVPNVIGMTIAYAENQLETLSDLILGNINVAPVVQSPPAQVLAQVKVGASVPMESPIEVTVSIPPDPFQFLKTGSSTSQAQSEEEAYAYYRAVDPLNKKDTLRKWIAENGYGQPGGVEARAVYFNSFDLGFGRHMYMHREAGRTAFYVTNHDTLDEAWQSPNNTLVTVAMEYSPGPSGGAPYVKFYTFDKDGNRTIEVDLDGRGERTQPQMCMTCHGGQPSVLSGGEYPNEGRTGARFIPFDLDTFKYTEKNDAYSRETQEAEFKVFNSAVFDHLISLEAGPEFFSGDLDAAKDTIEGWYGGNGLPSDFNGAYVPASWNSEATLYSEVVAPSCRACHLQRTAAPTTDFSSESDFSSLGSQIREHVFNQGDMPNALQTYKNFWLSTNPEQYNLLADYLTSILFPPTTTPGNPRAEMAVSGDTSSAGNPITLHAGASLFANEYEWSFDFVPFNSTVTDVSFDNRFAQDATFTPDLDGFYKVRLTVSKAGLMDVLEPPGPGTTIEIGFPPPLQSFVTDIVPIFSTAPANCTACHSGGSPSGNMHLGGTVNQIYNELTVELSVSESLPRVNLVSPSLSLILRKPTQDGIAHGGGTRWTKNAGDYLPLLWWIQQGAPNN